MLRFTLALLCLLIVGSSAFAQSAKENVNKKTSVLLLKKLQTLNFTDSIDLYISYVGKDLLQLNGFHIIDRYTPGGIVLVRIRANAITALLQEKQVLFADVYEKPKEELTTGTLDLATNKVNLAHNSFPFINGENISISIKENKADTTDLDYIGRYFNSGMNSSIYSPHASIMATTIAGAGNTSSYSKGVAHKSRITSSNFANLLPDPDVIFKQFGITVQNHSYGTVIQNYYGAEAMAYDISSITNPELLHVFSSGNTGNASGTGNYSTIAGFANLTGNFKAAKNSLTIGSIDSFYTVPAASSKGPAYDGRLKPELVAFGEDGSSGAAAMVSGSAALVQQAYRLKKGALPASHTTKAVLINSASDIGAMDIDFSSGYGSLNTYEAVNTIQENRIFESSIRSNETQRFSIKIPGNAALLKVTLVWTDPAANVNAAKALVNDLNLVIKSSTGSWLPWVLSHQPHLDSLRLLPERKVDTLNTIEQVTIKNPSGDTYLVEVAAGILVNNQQSFTVAYQVDTLESITWSFPTASDNIEAGASNIIRWHTNKTGAAVLEYSVNNTDWKRIATLPDISLGYYKWQAPDSTTTGWLRLQSGMQTIISEPFVISSIPQMDVGFNCADSFLLFWNKQPVANYQLYALDDNYLSSIMVINDSFTLLKKAQHPSQYYSVAPLVNGKPGFRSAILNYPAQGVDCYFKSFFLQTQNESTASLYSSVGSTYGVSAISFQKRSGQTFSTLQTIPQPTNTQFVFIDPSLTQGVNQYRIVLQLSNGQLIYSEVVTTYYFNNKEVIIYPNPVAQQQPIHILASRAGRTAIQVYNSSGVIVTEMRLRDLRQPIPPLLLNKGLYFIKVIDEENATTSTQKLVVY